VSVAEGSEALHLLLEVQAIDTAIDQVRHQRSHHPLRSELSTLLAHQVHLTERLAGERAGLDALATRQSELEAAVTEGAERIAVLEKRMYSGEVSASRELQAMSEEVASIRRRDSSIEDSILEVMEEREPVESAVAELEAQLAEVVARAGQLEAALAEADESLAAQERELQAQRDERSTGVPPDLLSRYSRLRERLGGVGVAPLVDGRCGGCHLALSATELDGVRRAPADAVLTCEQCGRLLVRP